MQIKRPNTVILKILPIYRFQTVWLWLIVKMQLRSFSANYGGMFALEFLENLVKNLPAHFCHLMMMFFCEFMTSFAYAHRNNIQLTEKRRCTCGILTIQFIIVYRRMIAIFQTIYDQYHTLDIFKLSLKFL